MRALRPIAGRRDSVARAIRSAGVLALLSVSERAHAASEPNERTISPNEVVSWLDSNGEKTRADSGAEEEELAPPPPPRHKGFVVESGIGAFGQIGEMKHISPIAPWFHLQFGYEPFRFLMVFAEGDLMVSNTSYAHQPPPTRTYSLWGVGAGLRGTVKVSDRVGLYLQGSLGGAEVTADVLYSYGYRNADKFNLYLAGELGLEWYQVSPHLALTVHGGIRDYTRTFNRDLSSQPPLAWVSALGLRYTF
ncbi:MAG: hypothetical protein ABIQ16_14770 [Polyangiaceae bacterium]